MGRSRIANLRGRPVVDGPLTRVDHNPAYTHAVEIDTNPKRQRGTGLGSARKSTSLFAPRKTATFAERKATIRHLLIFRLSALADASG